MHFIFTSRWLYACMYNRVTAKLKDEFEKRNVKAIALMMLNRIKAGLTTLTKLKI